MDRLVLTGLIIGVGSLLGTQLLEGGHLAALLQGPAAIIVFAGTLGATLLSSSAESLNAARVQLRHVARVDQDRRKILPTRYRDLAFLARKDGLVSLDKHMRTLPTAFMQRALAHVIDGCDETQLEEILRSDIESRQRSAIDAARVLEIAGGYAPTMGILGAVLGLVRAMEALADPDALGQGIAVAFIATIYGVGLANLILLPLAARIRERSEQSAREDEMVFEGTLGLQAGLSPRLIERSLRAHLVAESDS